MENLLAKILEKETEAHKQVEELQEIQETIGSSESEEDLETKKLVFESFFMLSIQQMKLAVMKAQLGIVGKDWYKDG